MNPYKYLLKNLSHHSEGYQRLVVRTYFEVLNQIIKRAKLNLLKGIFYSFFNQEKKEKAFIDGSILWGDAMIHVTKTKMHLIGKFEIPENGHMIFLNHVNELDFPFDCYIIHKPFLANQAIKSSYFAYWWMKAMGSEVFDSSHARTISSSVRNLVKGLTKHTYIVYPEGHNSYSEEIKPLKKGMVKIAFENKIPIVLILKSGIAKFQKKQKNNVIGYKYTGLIDPNQFQTWEEMRDFIFKKMVEEKAILDEEVARIEDQENSNSK